jgi:hypothetical protein
MTRQWSIDAERLNEIEPWIAPRIARRVLMIKPAAKNAAPH